LASLSGRRLPRSDGPKTTKTVPEPDVAVPILLPLLDELERDRKWYIGTVLKSQAPTARARQSRNASRISWMWLRSSCKTGGRTLSVVCLLMLFWT